MVCVGAYHAPSTLAWAVVAQVLTQSLKSRNNALYRVFGSAYAVTTTMYTLASIVIVLYFGDGTKASVNVNWSKFTGGYASGHVRTSTRLPRVCCWRRNSPGNDVWGCAYQEPWWVLFISYMVVLFPALDVISVMPINGIIVASNIMSFVYGDEYVARVALVPATRLCPPPRPGTQGVNSPARGRWCCLPLAALPRRNRTGFW